jgi:hypothetical protein
MELRTVSHCILNRQPSALGGRVQGQMEPRTVSNSLSCCSTVHGGNGRRPWTPERHAIGRTHAGFTPSNINHELCHYTDDITRMLASRPGGEGSNRILECNTLTMNSVAALMTSHSRAWDPIASSSAN